MSDTENEASLKPTYCANWDDRSSSDDETKPKKNDDTKG